MSDISIGGEGRLHRSGTMSPGLLWPLAVPSCARLGRARSPVPTLALVSIVLFLYLRWAAPGEKETEPTVGVQVVAVKKATIEQTVASEAILFPLAQSAIVPKISAPVKAFYVNRGSKVHAGTVARQIGKPRLSRGRSG